jgi:hypothetical protein
MADPLVVPRTVSAGETVTVFTVMFANEDAPGTKVDLTISNGSGIVASQSWTLNFTPYDLQTETYDWTAPTGAAAGPIRRRSRS